MTRRRAVGDVGISLGFLRAVGEGESWGFVFRAFHGSVIFHGVLFLFELQRGETLQCRMESLAIVCFFQKFFNPALGILQSVLRSALNFFFFQRPREALRLGVVIRVAFSAHAGQDLSFLQQFCVALCRILGGFNRSSQHP